MTPEERIVRLETQMQDQREDMRRVMAKLDELTAAANQGRGMLAMLVTGGAIAGRLIDKRKGGGISQEEAEVDFPACLSALIPKDKIYASPIAESKSL